MGKFLTENGWKQIVKKHEAKDGGLQKALGEYEDYAKRADPNEYSDQLTALKDIKDIAAGLKKDKKLAPDDVSRELIVKHLDKMIDEANAEIKTVFAAKKKYESDSAKDGLKKAEVQVMATNWDGDVMRGYQAFVVFAAPGFKKVAVAKEFKGGEASFDDIEIPPEGAVRIMAVSKGKATLAPEGVAKYKLADKGVMQFTAVQANDEVKVKATSGEEATKKTGATGNAGVDFKIFSAGVELTKEDEQKKSVGREVEFTVKFGKSSFKVDQVK